MLNKTDLIHLPYAPDLTQSGIAYAVRSLHSTFERAGSSTFSRLRRAVGSVAVELAFRRYLSEQNIPYETKVHAAFSDPEKYDVSLGGHRCDLKSFLISKRDQITEIKHNPGLMLSAPALIPSDHFAAENQSEQDIYLFAFLLGLTTVSREESVKAQSAHQPTYFVHPFKKEWARPEQWNSLGELVLKSECSETLTVEIGGHNAAREFITATVELPSMKRVAVSENFYSLSYLHANLLPSARIGIHSPSMRETYLIPPLEWGNIWVYGMDIYLVGYISRAEFRRHVEQIPLGTRVFQYNETRTKNVAVSMLKLNPIKELAEKVRAWENLKK